MEKEWRAGIIGASGYTGAELVRLLAGHSRLELRYLAAREKAGLCLGQVIPSTLGVRGLSEMIIERVSEADVAGLRERLDVVFLALPHGTSASLARPLLDAGLVVVDLSADFRLSKAAYEATYGVHPSPELLQAAVYGQPETHRSQLLDAKLIAAPGCHVTTAVLPLFPLLRAGLLAPSPIIIDSKSGISGGGRSPQAAYHFPEAAEGLRPYKVAGTHRHVPEIEQELSLALGAEVRVMFTPQLAPMTRGILVTAYAMPKPGVSAADCRAAARAFYEQGLVTVLDEGTLPDTLWVRGSARAHVAYAVDSRTGLLLAMSAIDNLARGASAQAIQAFNVSRGWPDATGLPEVGMFP